MVDRECFSLLGRQYRSKNSFWTLAEFPAFLENAWKRRKASPQISSDIAVCHWRDFFKPATRNIAHHSHPKAFKLQGTNTGVYLFYKKSVLSKDWLGFKG